MGILGTQFLEDIQKTLVMLKDSKSPKLNELIDTILALIKEYNSKSKLELIGMFTAFKIYNSKLDPAGFFTPKIYTDLANLLTKAYPVILELRGDKKPLDTKELAKLALKIVKKSLNYTDDQHGQSLSDKFIAFAEKRSKAAKAEPAATEKTKKSYLDRALGFKGKIKSAANSKDKTKTVPATVNVLQAYGLVISETKVDFDVQFPNLLLYLNSLTYLLFNALHGTEILDGLFAKDTDKELNAKKIEVVQFLIANNIRLTVPQMKQIDSLLAKTEIEGFTKQQLASFQEQLRKHKDGLTAIIKKNKVNYTPYFGEFADIIVDFYLLFKTISLPKLLIVGHSRIIEYIPYSLDMLIDYNDSRSFFSLYNLISRSSFTQDESYDIDFTFLKYLSKRFEALPKEPKEKFALELQSLLGKLSTVEDEQTKKFLLKQYAESLKGYINENRGRLNIGQFITDACKDNDTLRANLLSYALDDIIFRTTIMIGSGQPLTEEQFRDILTLHGGFLLKISKNQVPEIEPLIKDNITVFLTTLKNDKKHSSLYTLVEPSFTPKPILLSAGGSSDSSASTSTYTGPTDTPSPTSSPTPTQKR